MTTYHNTFIPFTDVYELGGNGVFHNLERKEGDGRNLVVVPSSLVRSLGQLEKKGMVGAAESLEYLTSAMTRKTLIAEGSALAQPLAGLDIIIIDDSDQPLDVHALIGKLPEEYRAVEPVIVTNDRKDHITHGLRGVRVERPQFLQVSADIVNEGIIDGNAALLERLYSQQQTVPCEEAESILGRDLFPWQFLRFAGSPKYVYAKVVGKPIREGDSVLGLEDKVVKLLDEKEYARKIRIGEHVRNSLFGISPRNMEQYLALQYGLLNPDVSIFFLCGSQGSGKTLLSYVAAIDSVLVYDKGVREKRMMDGTGKNGSFEQIVLLKPTEVMGGKRREVGHLPGNLFEKIRPHLDPYIDAHRESDLGELFPFEDLLRHPKFRNQLFNEPRSDDGKKKIAGEAYLPAHKEVIEMTYSGFIRGRSFSNTLVLVDEAQNYTPYELKTILERLGPGCKAIVMGDPLQVDNVGLCSREINGLTSLIKHYIGQPFSGLVKLSTNYRSEVSRRAGELKVFSS
ncbi:MAG: PhoH family protein [Nanoarchaeota archaeon]